MAFHFYRGCSPFSVNRVALEVFEWTSRKFFLAKVFFLYDFSLFLFSLSLSPLNNYRHTAAVGNFAFAGETVGYLVPFHDTPLSSEDSTREISFEESFCRYTSRWLQCQCRCYFFNAFWPPIRARLELELAQLNFENVYNDDSTWTKNLFRGVAWNSLLKDNVSQYLMAAMSNSMSRKITYLPIVGGRAVVENPKQIFKYFEHFQKPSWESWKCTWPVLGGHR